MGNKTNVNFVNLDLNGVDISGRNPLESLLRNEYALYKAMTEQFASVDCRSMCIGVLEMYFSELPHRKKKNDDSNRPEKSRITQESTLDAMRKLISRDVIGKINFPMMNICRVEVCTIPKEDGSHTFVFSDGIYSFTLRLEMGKSRPRRILLTREGDTDTINMPREGTA